MAGYQTENKMNNHNCPHDENIICHECLEERGKVLLKLALEESSEETNAKNIQLSGIPLRYQKAGCTIRHEEEKQYYKLARRYVKDFPLVGSLILCGKTGAGKTHLACWVGINIIQTYPMKKVVYTTAAKVFRSIKAGFSSEGGEQKAMDTFIYPALLIIDEIGKQFGTEYEKNTLFEIIDVRYGEHKPTILVSNYHISNIQELLGEPTMERLKENGGAVLGFTWASRRDQKGAPGGNQYE